MGHCKVQDLARVVGGEVGGGGLSRFVARVKSWNTRTCRNMLEHQAGTPNMFRSTSMFGVSDFS